MNEDGEDSPSEWLKSSRSWETANCVEVRRTGSRVGIRDSKNKDGGTLDINVEDFGVFINDIRTGRFNYSSR